MSSHRSSTRRRFLQTLGAGAGLALFSRRGLFAEALSLQPTATTTEGPFYPDKMPLDTDNDLLIINDAITPAVGEVTHLTGRVLTMTGQPVRNAFVEIWQVDSTASYVHTEGRQPTGHDANFQGYGRFLTDSKGQYYFRTIKPISYTLIGIFRTAHIHVAISRNGKRVFTTQLLVKGLRTTRATASSSGSTRKRSTRCSSASPRCQDRRSANWPRLSISCSARRSKSSKTAHSAAASRSQRFRAGVARDNPDRSLILSAQRSRRR